MTRPAALKLKAGVAVILEPNERVLVQIDGPNFFATGRALGVYVDFSRLLTFLRNKSQVVKAIYYTALTDDSTLHPMIDWLDYNGFTVSTKPAKEFVDANGQKRVKGSIDVEIVVDAMRLGQRFDHIVLFSGNGDFAPMIEAVQSQGKRVTVISTLVTQPVMISDELRRQADQFVDLADIEDHVVRIQEPADA